MNWLWITAMDKTIAQHCPKASNLYSVRYSGGTFQQQKRVVLILSRRDVPRGPVQTKAMHMLCGTIFVAMKHFANINMPEFVFMYSVTNGLSHDGQSGRTVVGVSISKTHSGTDVCSGGGLPMRNGLPHEGKYDRTLVGVSTCNTHSATIDCDGEHRLFLKLGVHHNPKCLHVHVAILKGGPLHCKMEKLWHDVQDLNFNYSGTWGFSRYLRILGHISILGFSGWNALGNLLAGPLVALF